MEKRRVRGWGLGEIDDPGGDGKGRPTLKTIAFMTGLGITTVSRALKDAPDIGQETKKRVRLVAGQIGYRPNRAGVRLRTGKTNVISLILDANETHGGFAAAMIYGILARLASSPYHLIVTPVLEGQDPLEAVRYVAETGSADGVILSRTEPRDRRVRFLMDRRIPFATHGRTLLETAHPFVDFDNVRFGRFAVRKLHGKGRKRIGLIGPPPELTFHKHMWQGFAEGIEETGAAEHALRGLDLDTPITAVRAFAAMLALQAERPDGIIAASGSAGMAFVSGYESTGLVLGRDFDVVTKETVPLQQFFRDDLMIIPEDFRAAGGLLAEALMRSIAGEDARKLQTIIEPDEP
jgi:LacI family transcriptional regulator